MANLQNPAAFGTLAGVCYEGKAACMWIVMLNGGLGNQMFQYIFALYLAQNGARVMIDDSAFLAWMWRTGALRCLSFSHRACCRV